MGMINPCSVGLIDFLRFCACQHVHIVKAVGSKFVSFITVISDVYFIFPRPVHNVPSSLECYY